MLFQFIKFIPALVIELLKNNKKIDVSTINQIKLDLKILIIYSDKTMVLNYKMLKKK